MYLSYLLGEIVAGKVWGYLKNIKWRKFFIEISGLIKETLSSKDTMAGNWVLKK